MNNNGIDKQIRRWQREIIRGTLTRRQFLAGASAAGLAAGAPLIYEDARAAMPKKGGMLMGGLAHGSTTDAPDPGTWENDFTISLTYITNGYLTEIDEHNQLIGELAEAWEGSPDVRTWTFKLRPGVTFHNGKDLTADDVVASINFHRGEDSTSAAKTYVDQIADIKADGKSVVVVTLKAGNADFPYFMSDYHIPVKPASGGSIDYESFGSGSGAYVLESWEPGVRATFTRNPNYWKEGRAHFDGGSLITIADVTARTNALTTGEVNMIDRVDTKTAGRLDQHPRVSVEETQGNGHYSFPMRSHLPPFDDNNVRLALKYALDREEMLEKVLNGHGYIGNDTPIGRGNAYVASEKELPQKAYDPDKAKHYLKQAGLSSLNVELAAADAAFGGAVDASVLFQENARAAGITIDVARVPDDGYWSNVWNTDNHKWCACYWGGRPTEDLMFSVAYAATAEWNDSNWKHPRFNDLLKQARVQLDSGKRRELYVEMQRIVSDEGAVMVPVFNNFIHAIAKDEIAHDEAMASNWSNDGHRYMERWWHL
jgi:peptide/nickel transport system substrate-binding protein